jgi:WD40 repeat protein
VKFSPVVDGLLWTSSLDMTVRLHDVETGEEISTLELNLRETSQANSMSFNFDASMVALSCKDRAIRICDPRSNRYLSIYYLYLSIITHYV